MKSQYNDWFILVELTEQEEEEKEQDTLIDSLVLDPAKIQSFSFATYIPPNVKDDMVRYSWNPLASCF